MRLVGVALLFTVRAARAAAGADAGAGPPHPDAAAVSWLTVEANEGGSSGGHTALRLGDEVFHFQHEAPGRLRLHRDPLATFHHEYALLGNRGVREARIPVSADTFELLRDTFVRRQLVEDAELAEEAARRQDVAWVELLLRRRAAGPDPTPRSDGLALPALGFFLGDGSAAPASPGSSHALAALRARIERERGPEFLERREAALRAALVASPLPAPSPETPALDPDRLVAFPPTASARDVDRETALHALALLRAAPALRPDAAADRDSPELALRPGEAEALRSAAAALEGELAELVASPRPGWGPPFALGLARLAAIDASLAGDRLVLLDAFPDDAATVTLRGDAGARHAAWLEREMRAALERARARALGGAGFREIDWSALETAASRLGDARRARANGARFASRAASSCPRARHVAAISSIRRPARPPWSQPSRPRALRPTASGGPSTRPIPTRSSPGTASRSSSRRSTPPSPRRPRYEAGRRACRGRMRRPLPPGRASAAASTVDTASCSFPPSRPAPWRRPTPWRSASTGPPTGRSGSPRWRAASRRGASPCASRTP